MLNLDHENNWVIWLFIAAFAFVVLYTLWPYIVAPVIVVALVKGFSSQPTDLPVGEADLSGLFCGLEPNQFGPCLVTGSSDVSRAGISHPAITSRQ
ncbi:MAG: hypothetical protein NT154_07005 [Verrucomicrobia bacterium]|nr:hypothetical protein [Verrucomicrobiota bacterium]